MPTGMTGREMVDRYIQTPMPVSVPFNSQLEEIDKAMNDLARHGMLHLEPRRHVSTPLFPPSPASYRTPSPIATPSMHGSPSTVSSINHTSRLWEPRAPVKSNGLGLTTFGSSVW
ncbi:hypothetical protein TRVA0_061S00452 [Trichomonascus vanleenenianus]|uniref:uncharacterized protein n=1 Tax=Trichomonascus vanleenenianus TaxID=2268995 RepID=UPI003ECB4D52